MNQKGHKKNLRPAQPGNRNAEKSGAHSPRRQAEEAAKLEHAYAENPGLFLQQDQLRLYFSARGKLELFDRDIEENGVSDRDGNQRRIVGTHRRCLELCGRLNAELQAGEAEEYSDTEPFSEAEGLRTLRRMIHDHRVGGSARFAIIQFLLERVREPMSVDEAFFRGLEEMTDDELQRELEALMVPISTAGRHAHGKRTELEDPVILIRRLGSQDTIGDDDLVDLRDSVYARFNPRGSSPSSWDDR